MKAFAIVLALAGTSSVPAQQDRSAVLALLHDGRFDVARSTLRRPAAAARPDDLFFDAFTTYWQLVFDDENEDLRATLDKQLEAAIDAAENAVRDGVSGAAALWGGSAHLLLAQLRASQRRPLAAAFEAKKAKRLLESGTLAGQDATDALFGLGTYNYVADTVPGYVKGLRALLFLPKGIEPQGLEQLAATAAGSRSFALEARILLITIYASKHERLFQRAIEERNRMLEAFPDAIASSYASARLDLSLGRFEAARARLAQAEARAHFLGDVDPVVVRSTELLQARAELASLRPDLALATAERALATGSGLGPSIRRGLVDTRDAASREVAGIPWPKGSDASTPEQEAETFAALADANPGIPILALVAGDARLRAGRGEDAMAWFTRAAAFDLPADLKAGCRFRQAQVEDLAGRRSQAIELYGVAAATPGYVARDGASYYQHTPYGSVP